MSGYKLKYSVSVQETSLPANDKLGTSETTRLSFSDVAKFLESELHPVKEQSSEVTKVFNAELRTKNNKIRFFRSEN
jgi:hypothetical protein